MICWNYSSGVKLSVCRLEVLIPALPELLGTNHLTLPSQVFISKNFSVIKETPLPLLKHWKVFILKMCHLNCFLMNLLLMTAFFCLLAILLSSASSKLVTLYIFSYALKTVLHFLAASVATFSLFTFPYCFSAS